MNRNILYLSFLLSLTGVTQEILPVINDTTFDKNRLQISSQNYYGSNRLNNNFTDKFIFGGTITQAIKDKNFNRMDQNNRLGGEAKQQIEHFNPNIHPIKNEKYGLVISIADHHLVSANIPTDLYELAMFGNAGSINDTLNFSFAHFQYLHYQKFGIGIFDRTTQSSVKINYVSGSKAIEARMNDTWLYNGSDSLILHAQGAGYRTDRFYPYLGFQGSGVSIDLNYNFFFESKKGRRQFLNLKVNNLGFIGWNQNNHQYTIDSTSVYTGFNVNEILNRPEGETKNYNFTDTLGIYEGIGRNFAALPIEFVLQKSPIRNSDQKFQYTLGFKTILTSDYIPYVFGGLYYEPFDFFSASTRLAYGGFGGLQWGLNLNLWTKGNSYFSLGTFNMIGNLSKKIGFGRSINFSAHFNL